MQNREIIFHLFSRLPNSLIEAFETAVKMIAVVVLRELIFNSIQRKPAARDAICVSTNEGAEVAWIADVLFERVEAKHDVTQSTVAIGNFEGLDRAAISDDSRFQPAIVCDGVKINLDAVGHRAKVSSANVHRLLKTRLASSRVSAEPTSYQSPGTFQV